MKKNIFILASILSISFASKAQDTTETQKAQFKVSLNYNSALNYYGRIDSLESSGFFPMAELWFNPNFYINAAPIFVNNKVQSMEYAGTVASAGYQYMDEKWLTNLYVLKPFYKEGSELVQSALKAQTGISVSRLNKVLNVSVGGDVKFSDKVDLGAMAGIDHLFRIENADNSVLVIDPSFYVHGGTQQFSRTYTKKRNNGILLPPTNEEVTEEVNRFNLLAYEASVPIVYAKNKWMLIATPSYVVPKNLMTVQGRPDLSEYGRKMFYATLALKYTF
jgi:hypothetical protein